MTLNDRARELADRLAADAEAARVEVTTLANGARLIDCREGGFAAGRAFAEICMGGLGEVAYAPLVLDGRWFPGLTVATDHPAVACLAAQYAGWRIDRDGYFAMGSGPGRALIRAEELYDDLDWDEQASAAVLCLETRDKPPPEVAAFVAERAGVEPSALTLVMAPTASVTGSVQIAARVVETALHKLHELDFDVRRVVSGFGSCPLPPVADDDMAALGRTNDAVLYGGQVHLTVEADDDDALRELVERLPASASKDYGEPFGKVFKDAEYDFYKIDPLLFSPAQIRLTSLGSGRSFRGRRGRPRGAGALVLGLTVAILGSSGGWHARQLTDALEARGHEHRLVPVTRMVGRIDGDVTVPSLEGCDAVIVRRIPRGSLEQVIFRVDALHTLAVPCINSPRALERTIDKFLASALLARAGVPTPRTIACERRDDALEAFDELGGDVIVKPLFGAMGAGMTRVDDRDVAYGPSTRWRSSAPSTTCRRRSPPIATCGHSSSAGACWRRSTPRWARDRGEPGRRRAPGDLAGRPSRSACAWRLPRRWVSTTRASTCWATTLLELNGIPGWHGLQDATGADVAAALVEHVESGSTSTSRERSTARASRRG